MKHDWKYKRLGDVLLFDKRFNGLPQGEQEKVVKFSHVSAEKLKELYVENGDVRLISTGNYDGTTTIENAGENLSKGEIITIPTGGVANIKYYNGYFVDSGNIIAVSSDPTNWMRYIFYAMIANKDTINSFYRGVSIKHPYMPDIYNITIPVPPLPIQKQIVSLLDNLNLVIEKKKQQIEELDNLTQAIFYDMFGDIDTILLKWETKTMVEVCKIIVDCPHTTPIKSEVPTEYPCIRTSELRGGFIHWGSMQYVSKNEYEKRISRLTPQSGDIVYGREGSFGDAVVLPQGWHFCLGQRTMLFRPDNDIVCTHFLHRVLISDVVLRQAQDKNVASTVAHVNVKDIKQFVIPIPPLPLQQAFAEKVEAIERQKELINQSIKANIFTEVVFL